MLRQVNSKKEIVKKSETPQAVRSLMQASLARLSKALKLKEVKEAIDGILSLELDTLHVVKVRCGYIRRTNSGYAVYTGKADPTDHESIFTISGTVYDNGRSRFNGKTINPGEHYFSVIDENLAAVCVGLDMTVNPSNYSESAETVAASDNSGLAAAKAKLMDDYLAGNIDAKEMKALVKQLS